MMLGDKVKIGNFPAGTSIGFVLLQNAYTDGGNIITTNTKFYTDEEFNTVEPDINMRRHSVLLYSRSQEVYLIGFEDTRRDISTSDNDFNDLVFYVQTDPKSGIDPTGIPELDDRTTDTDGDGTPDAVDEFPTDPTRAYTRFYPTKNNWGTLAFEDQWPLEGDYDFNDLVLSYRYKFVMNSQNMVVDVIGEYSPLAAGAVFNNGFGIELPVSTDKVKSVTGYSHQLNYIRLNSNGTEAGQSSAVIIPFDNVRNLFSNQNYSGETYINTFLSRPKYTADTVRVTTTFNTPQYDASVIGKAPFNPFMISNVSNTYGNPDGRGKEIHLVNQKPTALANTNLLGTGADDSNSAQGRYYITADNRPFALNIVADFQYPI
ncbi:LruC domain-containing protein, partial [Pseudoxanthomonas sp. SGD-10]